MSSLLSSLMKKSSVTAETAETAKSDLTPDPVVNLVGINSPEFGDASTDASAKDVVDFGSVVIETTSMEDESTFTEAVGADPIDVVADTSSESMVDFGSVAIETASANAVGTDPMDAAYEASLSQEEQAPKSITIPQHDDGLDDEDAFLTPQHHVGVIPLEELSFENDEVSDDFDEEPEEATTPKGINESIGRVPFGHEDNDIPWDRKSFGSAYFNFSSRTVKNLERAELKCFDDIKGWAYSELKSLKGFGQGSLDELLEILEAENQPDWLLKRKRKVKNDKVSDVTPIEAPAESAIEDVETLVNEIPTEAIAELRVEEEDEVEDVSETVVDDQQTVEASQAQVDEAPSDENVESSESTQEEPQVVKSLNILVVGNASPTSSNANVVSFEQVYADAIREICQSASSPSLGMMEYGKGWQALSATIRQNGWPQGVDVLCVSKSFLSRSEVLMELRLLADVVVEG